MTLLERGPALEALQGALGEVAHGEGRVALVYGEAGIGKTSLVDCFARAPGQPGRTLWGACDSLHTPRPLGPVHDIAQQAAPHCSGGSQGALRGGSSKRSSKSSSAARR